MACFAAASARSMIGRFAYFDGLQLKLQGLGCALRNRHFVVGMAGITHDSHARQTRSSFPERFEPLGGELIRQECHAGGITARLSQACREAEQHRIWAHGVDNRDRLRRLRNMRSDVAAERKNHVGLAAHQSRGEFRKPLRPTLRKVILNRDVLAVERSQADGDLPGKPAYSDPGRVCCKSGRRREGGAPLAAHVPEMAGLPPQERPLLQQILFVAYRASAQALILYQIARHGAYEG